MENRLTDLEVRYTHLERQLDDLSQVVFEQRKLLDRMAKELTEVRSRMGTPEGNFVEDLPPHY